MDCPFCAIVAGEEDALVLDEREDTLAVAPLAAISEGHLLVIPKAHHPTIVEIPEETLSAVVAHAKSIVERLRENGFEGANLLHASGHAAQQSVDHFHVHVAPRRADDGLDLWPDSEYEADSREECYAAVREALAE
jgi:histidine triad (HIT) family protein